MMKFLQQSMRNKKINVAKAALDIASGRHLEHRDLLKKNQKEFWIKSFSKELGRLS